METIETSFSLSLLGGALQRHHRRLVGDLDRDFPWRTLDVTALAPELRRAAARRWTESAFNEHRSAVLMAQLLQCLGEVQAPLDLHSLACRFPAQELAHAEICARVAAGLGDGGPVPMGTLALTIPLPPGRTPIERCNEVVVRLCCVGETVSKEWLGSLHRRVRQPLVRAVLARLHREEALHSRFGWLYLGWLREDGLLDPAEAARLSGIAGEALAALEPPAPAPDEAAEEDWPDVLITLRRCDYRELVRTAGRGIRARLESYRAREGEGA